jgi:prepilin signal peptidase PulO-like enzyme (type II secretory pathway)
MIYFVFVSNFVFGAIIGSFLNVIILRHNTGKNITGRSSCSNCNSVLSWFELVPIFSWIMQKGRCRSCCARISIQYPLVETITGIVFVAAIFFSLPLLPHILLLVILSLLIAITVYDLKHTIIPNVWVYTFSILSLLFYALTFAGEINFIDILWRVLSGVVIASPFALIWLVSNGKWMGLGDAKLMMGIGILLGLEQGFFAVMSAFVVGAIFGLLLIFLSSDELKRILVGFTPTPISKKLVRGFTMKSEIPFGPFLIGVSVIVWFLNLHGINLSLETLTQGLPPHLFLLTKETFWRIAAVI